MPIIFNSKLDSAVANNTFMDITQDDATIGRVSLNEVLSGLSGDLVANAQLQINKNKKVIFGESGKSANGTISLDPISMNQEARVIGNGSAVSLNVLPFTGVQVVLDGTEITVVGHDDAFFVTIFYNDSDYGCYINGKASLKKGYAIKFSYNDELKRYIEISRNF